MVTTLALGLLAFGSFVTSATVQPEVVAQFQCIDLHGKVEPCPGNTRPTEWSPSQVAYIRYLNRINQTGWAELEVVTNPSQPDSAQAYYAGFIEGYLTAPLINR